MKILRLAAACGLALATQQALANPPHFHRPAPIIVPGPYRPDCTSPPIVLPPGVTIPPTTTPPTTTPPTTTPPTTPPTTTPEGLGLAPAAGTSAAASAAPNLYGDAFGTKLSTSRFILDRLALARGDIDTQITGPGNAPIRGQEGTYFIVRGIRSAQQLQSLTALPPGTTLLSTHVPAQFTTVLTLDQVNALLARNPGPPTPILAVQPASSAAVAELNRVFAQHNGAGGRALFVSADSGAFLQTPRSSLAIGSNPDFDLLQAYDYVVDVTIPSPSGGGVVGRTKISDDNNPLPRDRFIFNYDYFNSVTLAAGGVDVHRYSPGFEKTFFDGRASIEVRVPFASTLSSTIFSDGITGHDVELGNINLTLKALLYQSNSLYIASGLGIALPTADDVRVRMANGTELVRVHNDAVILTPYLAALMLPTDRLFIQTWAAIGFDANGNGTDVNAGFGGLRRVGRINDQSLAQFDAQVGYWLHRASNPDATLQGLAPFVEVHYNSTVGDADVINAGGFRVGQSGSLNELNLSAGLIAQIGANFNLAAGVVVPLRDRPDRTFDYQIGIRGSIFFGRTAAAQDIALQSSSF